MIEGGQVIDGLLDEIDRALAESAETEEEVKAFVDGFQQKGGQ